MPLDFPNSPTAGDVFAPAGSDRSWTYDGEKWVVSSSAPNNVDVFPAAFLTMGG